MREVYGSDKAYVSKLVLAVSVSPDRRFPVCWIDGFTAREYSMIFKFENRDFHLNGTVISNDRIGDGNHLRILNAACC